MSLSIKIAATLGVTSGTVVFLTEVAMQAAAAQSPGITGSPVVDGIIGGGTVTAVAIAVLKTRLDRMERDVEKKVDKERVDADKQNLNERLARIEGGLDQIRKHLMGDSA